MQRGAVTHPSSDSWGAWGCSSLLGFEAQAALHGPGSSGCWVSSGVCGHILGRACLCRVPGRVTEWGCSAGGTGPVSSTEGLRSLVKQLARLQLFGPWFLEC